MHMIDLKGIFDVTTYTNVRGLARGLQVLRTLNAMDDGRATSQQIADLTGLHRTTVRRLLETLMEEGFVRRSASDDSFRLTLAVRSLSEGFTDTERIATVAPPIMGQLLQRVAWPSDLTTPDGDAMIIRETTHRFSRLSFHRAMVGRRLPILLTAAGRAYFATCPDEEREDILELLRSGAGGEEQQAFARNDAPYASDPARARGWFRLESRRLGRTGENWCGCGRDQRGRTRDRQSQCRLPVTRGESRRCRSPLCARTAKAALDIAEALRQEPATRPHVST